MIHHLLSILTAIVFNHCFVQSVSLDGTWEMAYQPYEYPRELHRPPVFEGESVENAVPAYWEDLFRNDESHRYRFHPLYHPQQFPLEDAPQEMTLPNIYGAFFYRRTVTLEHGGEALLRFEGVRNQVHVWINGKFVAFRQGFSTPFEIRVNDGILHEGDNTIILAVSNCPNLGYCDKVCGLATRSIFEGTGGINGHLELAFPENDLGDVYVTTAEDLKTFTVHVSGKSRYHWEIRPADELSGSAVMSGDGSSDITLPADGLSFWTPESPNLYELKLVTRAGEYRQKFGLRRLTGVGERLFLNGSPVYLRGVTEHCYFPLTVHPPRDIEYYRMVTAKRKELGFNFVRFHTLVPPVEYLQACDELGMLVHIESPNFVDIPEYESIIAFARSHPSAVIYCTGNESRIDAIAEAYLEEIANRVHSMSDGLFSPMSALRGLEYHLFPGHDTIVNSPWPHNPERFKRVNRYADVYTAYLNSATSYNAINSTYTAELVDEWGDVYTHPRLSHEICIDGTYMDFSVEALYPADSPILQTGFFSSMRQMLSDRGILDKADIYFRNSCEWQRRCRKFCFEKIRSMKRVAGYDFLGDIDTHPHAFGYSVGIMDEFYRMKPSETVENVLRYNSAAILLCDLGSNFNFSAGERKTISFSISNFDSDVTGGVLTVTLSGPTGKRLFSRVMKGQDAPAGEVTDLCAVEIPFPDTDTPSACILKAEFKSDRVKAENVWEVYSFPKPKMPLSQNGIRVVDEISEDELISAMEAGETVVLFGAGPFRYLPATFQCGLPGRTAGNAATVIKTDHPALGDFPHEGFCGWQFRHLMENAKAVQLEAGIPFDPVIDVASSVKVPVKQSFLFEYTVGRGRLLVCSLHFTDDDPAASYLRSQIVSYAVSKKFNPSVRLTQQQLHAVIEAPLIQTNRKASPNNNAPDPAGVVRVPFNVYAQP